MFGFIAGESEEALVPLNYDFNTIELNIYSLDEVPTLELF